MKNGWECKRKPKKPLYKRWWFIVIIGFIALGAIGGMPGSDNERDVTVSGKTTANRTKDTIKKITRKYLTKQTNKKIYLEQENALRAAQNYLSTMPFSEKGLYGSASIGVW
ncbi:MAG: Ltp family lipoprotein [Candidatus Syntrophopropionicum ammoniitolerans]